jgi:dipeptidase
MKKFSCLVLAGFLVSTLAAVLVLRDRTVPGTTLPGAATGDEGLSQSCTVILVGRAASVDGSVFTTHAADCGVCDWTFHYVPAADHQPGQRRPVYNIGQIRTWPPAEGGKWEMIKKDPTGLELPQPAHTFGYLHGVFGYMNDQQLAMGESTIGNARRLTNPTPVPKLNITMLTLLAMERCKTAREAIKLMGTLAEKYGYGYLDGGEMLAVADSQEAWIFEIMPVGPLWKPDSGKPGAAWAARRVPDDQVSVCPNESRIGEIDLSRPDLFMASPNYKALAVENGLYDPRGGKPFSWKSAYAPAEGSAATNARRSRMWRFFNLVAPSLGLKPDLPNMDYPFSVRPDKKLSVADVMAITRDKSQGTPFDPVQGIRGGPLANPNIYKGTRLISISAAEYTTITQTRNWLPSPVGGILWLAFGAQDTSCYIPLYAGITALPSSFSAGDHWEFSRDSARWAFDYVDYHTQAVYSQAIQDVREAQVGHEQTSLARLRDIDLEAAEKFKTSPAEAAALLTKFCLANAEGVIKAWWKLGDDLLVKYNHLGFYEPANRSRDRSKPQAVPLWERAVKMVDVLTESSDK